MRGVEKDSVVHLAVQLWKEPWPYGMANEESDIRSSLQGFKKIIVHLLGRMLQM